MISDLPLKAAQRERNVEKAFVSIPFPGDGWYSCNEKVFREGLKEAEVYKLPPEESLCQNSNLQTLGQFARLNLVQRYWKSFLGNYSLKLFFECTPAGYGAETP
jgi:hypothetical protein